MKPVDNLADASLNALVQAGIGTDLTWVSGPVEAAFSAMVNGPVAPAVPAGTIGERLSRIDLSAGEGLERAVGEAAALMADGDLLSAHARCFGYFNPTPAWPGVLADLLSAVRNPQLCVVSHAPASVMMERKLIAWLNQALGFPASATGHFTSGGSEANATGLQVALARLFPGYDTEGAAALPGPARLYASADSHLAWIKLARAAGLGRNAVSLIPTDGAGRLDPDALRRTICDDRAAGAAPVMIAATAGTTNAGMIDPLHACADIAAETDLHLHVDAAWAGALIVDETRRPLLDGIERADSVTVDAHKWLAVPMGAGMVFVRDAEALSRAFAVTTSYMPAGDGVDAYVTSYQWSRRFIGLRLWMTLRTIGAAGYRAMFDRQFALADALRDGLTAHGWNIRNASSLPVVLFEDPEGRDSAALAAWLEADRQTWLGHVAFEGRPALRACITSYLTGPDDIEVLLDRLDAARAAVQPASR
ncbi:pyridoxal-dependent decarboxylase [Maricaulis sp.]|uniref:pyridoxal phosphate-dependent decarboxylase family protein n=1 Tax=Maricaulis sp. TaxID=1486257 RepID=UPI001B1BD22D|nr:pyridoxal-dependent decarboxylase [Maricaulis sp.]MBO6765981.1 aspartate aminotransferase family protein [Maricaulis sp.]